MAGCAWIAYLMALCPTLFYQDSPEFINTAFTLGISHPAGFPTYNLLAKALTLLPAGSIAFRVNLFSALAALGALVLSYAAAVSLLRLFFGDRKDARYVWAGLVPVGYLAFCRPFWEQSLQAEVYTLHVAFTAGLILLLLQWRLRDDVRFVYAAGLVYGLSAGNHATVAFYLPAIVLLFFCWCRQRPWLHLGRCVALFLLGLSIYAYLPIRSMAEPSFDWGNPETVAGFLFQVTDRKDAYSHFAVMRTGPAAAATGKASGVESAGQGLMKAGQTIGQVVKGIAVDLPRNLSPVSFLGLLIGGVLCFRRSPPLFGFFAILVGVNTTFFYTWRQESYLPTYLVATLLTAVVLHWGLAENPAPAAAPAAPSSKERLRWRPLVWALLVLLIPYTLAVHFNRVNRAGDYTAEALPKKMYLTLDHHALFLPALSWFYYYYHQDVERLRDDVTAVNVWDLLNPDPPAMLTQRRYPDLALPPKDAYDFSTKENQAAYIEAFLKANHPNRSILMEHNETFLEQTGFAAAFRPHRGMFVQYAPGETGGNDLAAWRELIGTLEEEVNRPGGGRHKLWASLPHFWMTSLALFARETGRYELEAEVYQVLSSFFGRNEAEWQLRWLENHLHRNQTQEAHALFQRMEEQWGNRYETDMARGLLAKHSGNVPSAVDAFSRAAQNRPAALQPWLEQAAVWAQSGDLARARQALKEARHRIASLLQWNAWTRIAALTRP